MTMLRVCKCGRLIPATRRRCPTCQRADSTRRRNKPSGMVYADPRWRKTRQLVLTRDDHTCQVCGAPATHVDHRPPITTLLARGDSPFDPDHCRAVCASCSGRADAARARGTRGGTPTIEKPIRPQIPRPIPARKVSPPAKTSAESWRFAGTSQWVSPDGTKVCSKCDQRLPVDRFRENPRLSAGLDSWCRPCHLEASRASRLRRREAGRQ